PAGAFETATLVHVEPAEKTAIADVPGFDEELTFHAGFKIDFEGIAKKRLDLTFPTPATLAESQTPYLGYYGISSRGPRIMLVDLLRRDGATLTTHHPEGSTVRMGGVSSNAIVNPSVVRDMLLGIDRASIMIGFSFQTAVNFVSFASPPVQLDFFIPPIKSMYFASFATERDRILVPIPQELPFHIIGVDPGSGLTVVDAPFDARPPDLPGEVGEVSLPSENDIGPYPVFVSPGRAHILDINADSFEDESIRNLVVTYDGSSATARVKNAATALPDHTRVEILNLRKGVMFAHDDFKIVGGAGIALPDVKVGDRLVFLIGDHDVDPSASAITVVFSEPIFIGSQEELRDQFKLLIADDPTAESLSFKPVTGLTNIAIKEDSGKRRITIDYPGGFKRGGRYRLELSEDIQDLDKTPLQLAQIKDGKPARLSFDFTVREPKGPLAAFDIPSGSVRDLALSGNILLVSALDAGILVYDVSNPAALEPVIPPDGTDPVPPQPIAVIPPPVGSSSQTWALAADDHGRFYATALSPMYGVVRSYRIEDFHCTAPPCTVDPNVVQKGNAIITWRTGINVGVPLASMMIGGWPEATPRKMQIVTKDSKPELQTFPPDPEPETPGGPVPGSLGNGFRTHTVTVEPQLGVQYDKQRVTVTNVTRNYSWSKDIDGATEVSIFGKAGDQIRVVRNISTMGVVSLFGHGVGVYDLNAVEANSRNLGNPGWKRMNDTLALDTGDGGYCGLNAPCDNASAALSGESCAITDLWLSPDAALAHVGEDPLGVFALSQNRGIAQLTVEPQAIDPENPDAPNVSCSRAGSLVLAEKVSGAGWAGHPRLNRLRRLYRLAKGADPYPRYTSIATYRRYDAKTEEATTYALVAGYEYGLLVAKVGDPSGLDRKSLVDVVWIPSGASSVRVMQEEELAIVVDGMGRVVLVNLAQIDESKKVDPAIPACSSIDCEWPLFPTVEACLTPIPPPDGAPAGTPPTPVPNNEDGLGFPDPRIVWISEKGLVKGNLAPVFDPDTGFIYTGNVLEKTMRVFSAVDPRIRFLAANPAGPAPLRETDRVIPLGIAPPKPAEDEVSLPPDPRAAFQIMMSLPGSLAESLSGGVAGIAVAVESELMAGAAAGQTPSYLPPAHLRRTSRSGAKDPRAVSFVLQHDAPPNPDPKLRFQRGWNRMISKWIVAIADPRAMSGYDWGTLTAQQKEDRGCFTCERPFHVTGTLGTDWFELYTAGRAISVRPENCANPSAGGCPGTGSIFSGTGYAYLGDATRRLERRVSTVMADTVRPTHVLTAANGAPAAVGTHQETFFVHSGEVMTNTVDLDAGGRAGWNVVLDRTYRSRTLGLTPLGAGWDSSMFRRLRELPTGDVEYRDGSGEVWLFRVVANGSSVAGPTADGTPLGTTLAGSYTSPVGLDLKLTRQRFGWRMRDAKQRITDFDDYGRLVMEADEFHNLTSDTGNVIVYSYDADGLLRRIVDPVGRTTTLTYEDGRLARAKDWRGREVAFNVEAGTGLLTYVDLPKTLAHSLRRQIYTYLSAAGTLTDRLELGTNIENIQEPGDTESRVTFAYETGGAKRDMVKSEAWHTTDNAGATFEYTLPSESGALPVATEAIVHDALKQKRTYALTAAAPKNFYDDRVHAEKIVEADVPRWESAAFAALPESVTKASYLNVPEVRTWTFGYVDGRLTTTKLGIGSGVVVETATPWTGINGDDTFAVVKTRDVTSPATTGLKQAFEYDGAFLASVESGELKVYTPEAHRDSLAPSSSDGGVKQQQHFDKHGRIEKVTASADSVPGPTTTAEGPPAVSGAGATTTIDPYSYTDTALHRRGMPERIVSGTTSPIATRFVYPDPYKVTASRNGRDYDTTTEYDETGNVIRVAVRGTGVDSEETYAYDARGRMVRQRTKQSEGRYVEERYDYDRVGRMTRHETWETGITPSAEPLQKTTTTYNLPNRETVTTLPDGGTITSTLDGLGRLQDRVTDPKQPTYATFMTERTRYDVHGNVVFRGDDLTASATRYDAAHRPVETLDSAGIRTAMKLDGFGRLTNVHRNDTDFDLTNQFTPGGKLQLTKTNSSETTFVWDGAGRTRATTSKAPGAPDSITNLEYDDAGRLRKEMFGGGSLDVITQLLGGATYHYAGGATDQPSSITSSENGFIDAYQQTPTFDALTRPQVITTAGAGDMTIDQSYDAMGNVTTSKTPSMPGTMKYEHDARGLVTEEKKPAIAAGSEAVTKLGYSASGVLESYTDPTGEPTKTTLDGLGRQVRRDYPDFTFEEIHYTHHRVTKVRDRQGRTQEFVYDAAGRLDQVLGSGGVALDDLDYDDKGRLVSWRTPESRLEFFGYDPEGRPTGTKQIRLRADGTAIDEYSQSHTWDGFGRRTSWSMPGGGALTAGWTSTVQQQYDAAGNLIRLDRSGAGGASTLLTADYRAPGRPKHRTLNSGTAAEVRREYGYEPSAGRLNAFRVYSGSMLMAGSEVVLYEGTLLKGVKLLGLANGERVTSWEYDDWGRLKASAAASNDPNAAASLAPNTILPKFSDADFLEEVAKSGAPAPAKTFGETEAG
ncbi:DUF6531 domain-containing protein, partial [Candidatus Uhrbacteria bacterium]|nr:DUF6531 domain-containing protein [Candidatus Uhrbacteria bacterium]